LATYREQSIEPEVEQVILVESSIEPIGFNNVLTDTQSKVIKNAKIFGFLSRYDDMLIDINKILHIFNTYPFVNYVYTDKIIKKDNNLQSVCFPSFLSTAFTKSIIQTPLFVRKTSLLFDIKLKWLYFHKMLQDLSKISLGYHLPQFGIQTQHSTFLSQDIQSELKYINEQSS
jgi:hypothetical protein